MWYVVHTYIPVFYFFTFVVCSTIIINYYMWPHIKIYFIFFYLSSLVTFYSTEYSTRYLGCVCTPVHLLFDTFMIIVHDIVLATCHSTTW
jgi:hypothetical protein